MRRALLLLMAASLALALMLETAISAEAENLESPALAIHLMSLMVPASESEQMISVLAQLMRQGMEQQVAMLEDQLAQLPPDRQEVARQYLAGRSDRYADSMKHFFRNLDLGTLTREIYASAYAERFSPLELQQLIAFYESAVGRRISQENSELAEQVMPKLMQRVQPQVEEFRAEFQASEQSMLGELLATE